MLDISQIKIGQKVHYQPKHFPAKFENGMVKEIPDHTNLEIRVVYHCNSDWNNFADYTSALTKIEDLHLGWKH